MIKYLLIALCISGTKLSFGSYITTSLIQLVERAACISYGRIVAVGKEEFKIVVLQNVKACKQHDTITIRKFNNWACASRYADYALGQEAVFFLSSYKGELATLGSANEGELIVKHDTGYVESDVQHTLKAKPVVFIPTYSACIPMRLQTILEGLALYLENREAIDRQFARNNEGGTVAYRYNYTDMLPKNEFLRLLVDQK